MTADDLLAKLEKGELVAPEVIASLRRQVTAAKEPIAPAVIAKLLVDKGHLTAGQAARLVEQPSASQIGQKPASLTDTATSTGTSKITKPVSPSTIQKPAPAAPAPVTTAPPAAMHSSSVHDDLGLAPLDDLDALSSPSQKPAQSAAKSAVQPAAKSAVQPAAKSAVQPAAKSAVQPAAKSAALHSSSVHDDLGLAPLDDLDAPSTTSPSQQTAEKSTVQPAAKSAVKAAPAVAPSLDDLGLAPLDDLPPVSAPAPAAKSTIQKTALQNPTPAAPQKSAIQKAPTKAAPAPPPLDDLGGLESLDDLQTLDGLDSLGSDPLGGPLGADPLASGGLADLGALGTQTAAPAKPQISPATVAAAQAASESRTTLFVGLGIGGAAMLVVVIGLVVMLWPRGDGMLVFQAAEQAYQEKQYPAAAEKYDEFLKLHPRHEQASLVRVHRGMCAIQGASTSPPDWVRLLPVMSDTTAAIAAEPTLGQVHADLVPLLIKMTEGLADAATSQKVDQQTSQRLQQARAALTLCNDSRLLPSTQRPWQKLADIEDRLQILAREVQKTTAREQAKSTVSAALASGNLAAALAARGKLLEQYPEFAGDEMWTELAPEFATAASQGVKVVADKKVAERDPAPTPVQAAFPWQLLNARLQENPPEPSERVLLTAAAGAVHALDSTTGHARWSRYLANSDSPVTSADGKFAWLVDRRQNELQGVMAASGNLLWRQTLPHSVAGSPLLVRDKLYVALTNGKLLTIDSSTGELQSTLELPQPLIIGPAASADGQASQLADEGLLYVITLADGKCSAVHLGFERGTARFPPVMFDGRIVVAATRGEQTELHLIRLEEGKATIKRQRISGVIAAPLVSLGRALFVSTADGKIQLLEKSDGNEPLKIAQTIPATSSRLLRNLQATREGVIAADRGLSLFKLDSSGKVQPSWNAFSADTFDGPGSFQDESLFISRYVADQQMLFAARINSNDGLAPWQSPLNPPLLLLADQEEGSRPVAVPAAAVAKLLTLDASVDLSAEFKKLLSQPMNVNLKALPLGELLAVGEEQLFVPSPGARELLFVKPADYSVRKLPLASPLAGRPAVAGQNLLVPLTDGSIQCLNAISGETTAAPFLLPPSAANVSITALDVSGQSVLVSDGTQSLVRIALIAEPKPHWLEQAAIRLPQPLVAPPVALAELVFAADRRGLQVYSLPELTAGQSIDLKGGQVTWGPHRAGDNVLLATDRDELWCCDATRQPRWQQPLPAGQPVGPPLVRDGKLIVNLSSGMLEIRSASSGDVTASANTRQPLAGSAALSGSSIWLTTTCGQVIQVALPTEVAK